MNPSIHHDGRQNRHLVLHQSRPKFTASVPSLSSKLLPRSEWREFDETFAKVAIKDQGERGACNGHAAASSLEDARAVANMPHVPLSAWYIYATLCKGQDVGSNIGEALSLLEVSGTCSESLVAYSTIDPARLSPQAKSDAKRFRVEIGHKMTTWDEVMTAVQLRMPLNLSVRVGPNFNNLDSEGVPPYEPGVANHAVSATFAAKKSRRRGWLIKIRNSWGTRWGQGGYFWIGSTHVELDWFEAYSVVAPHSDPTWAKIPMPVFSWDDPIRTKIREPRDGVW